MGEEQTPASIEGAARSVVEQARVLLRSSDLDLVVFFARHPRCLLSSESLCAFLGYELKNIAESLDALLAAGILRRRQTPAHAARLYELIADAPPAGDWLDSLLALARTRRGRLALLTEIERRSRGARNQRPGPRWIVTPGSDATNEAKTG